MFKTYFVHNCDTRLTLSMFCVKKTPPHEIVSWCSGHVCCAKSLQLCPTLCNPVDHSPLASSVHGIVHSTTLPTKARLVKAMVSQVELWCWRRLLRVPWTARRSNQSILKEMSRILIGRIDAKAETPILWPPDAKNWLIGKDPDAGKDWRWEETGMTEDEVVGWHHWLNGHELE